MKPEKRLYIDIHVLQTVPPSCVNRDDTGSPKTAIYGGVQRARVSSQSWKHAVRAYFRDHLDKDLLAYRTKSSEELVANYLEQSSFSHEEALSLAAKALKDANVKASEDAKKDALFFISNAQAKAVAEAVATTKDDEKAQKEAVKKALSEAPGLEIALFGRMVAGDTSLNVDACCQVAHAISTHKVSNEFDYFTAVDDIHAEDDDSTDRGAGHIGTNEFNSSTLYRYATVAAHDLIEHLGGATAKAVCDFVEAFVLSMPTGKLNSYANRTVPDAVLIAVRDDQPINFVGAFESPVRAGADGGFVTSSEKALEKYVENEYASFVQKPACAYVVGGLDPSLGQRVSFTELKALLEGKLETLLA